MSAYSTLHSIYIKAIKSMIRERAPRDVYTYTVFFFFIVTCSLSCSRSPSLCSRYAHFIWNVIILLLQLLQRKLFFPFLTPCNKKTRCSIGFPLMALGFRLWTAVTMGTNSQKENERVSLMCIACNFVIKDSLRKWANSIENPSH